jgi:hypothetical protein
MIYEVWNTEEEMYLRTRSWRRAAKEARYQISNLRGDEWMFIVIKEYTLRSWLFGFLRKLALPSGESYRSSNRKYFLSKGQKWFL